MPIDFEKLPSDEHLTFYVGPTATGVLGITDVGEPLADELNNTGGTSGMLNASVSVSWNDWSFGLDASETLSEPSLADASTYEEFGQSNFGGSVSFWMPLEYDDNSNQHSLVYDLTDIPLTRLDAATRLDGEVKTSVPAANGDFVSAFRVQTNGEVNPFTPGESKRRTVSFLPKSEFSNFVVVGDHAITAIEPASFGAGTKGRIRASQQGRDTTNYLRFTTDDASVIQVYPGGAYKVTGVAEATATVTVTDPETGDNDTVAVTVS